MQRELHGLLQPPGVKFLIPEEIQIYHLKIIWKNLYMKAKAEKLVRVSGKGHHKSALQKAINTVNGWLEKMKRYT